MSGFVRDGLAGREGSMRTYAASALGHKQKFVMTQTVVAGLPHPPGGATLFSTSPE